MAGRTILFSISLGAHVVLGGALAALPARARREIVAITMASTPKPKPAAVTPPPPPPPEPAKASPRPTVARAAPPPKTAPAPAVSDAPPSAGDAVPDFGLSLSNAGGPGLAVPSGPHPSAPPAVTAAPRTLSRAARPAADACDEPEAKPKPLSRTTPVYTDDARAAGISGKVRVEITVDEHGRVTAARVLAGLGHGLDESAIAAARAMTFEPALRCGKPSAATFKIGFSFAPGTP